MGNCCAAQKAAAFNTDDSNRPLKPNQADRNKEKEKDTASANTRPGTPSLVSDKVKRDVGKGKQGDESPEIIGDRRKNTINQLEPLQSRDPPSQGTSQVSSTIPGENSALTINRTINDANGDREGMLGARN